jgi:hypothetical protein
LDNPTKIVPRTAVAHDLGQSFVYRFQPNSVTVLRIGADRHQHQNQLVRIGSSGTHFNLKARTGVSGFRFEASFAPATFVTWKRN